VRGHRLIERRAGDLGLALLRPSIPEHGIHHHAHAEMHMVMLLAGRYVSSAHGMPEVCAAPVIVFNPPGTEHRDRFRSRDGLFLTLSLPAQRHVEYGETPCAGAPALRLDAAALPLGFAVLRAVLAWDAGAPLAVQGLVAELIGQASPAPPPRADKPVLRRALERLHQGGDWPDMGTLAAAAGVHPVYLARVFRQQLGTTPAAWLRRLRAVEALALLSRGHTGARAAELSGHVDASHLGRALQRELGITPGVFRRQLRTGGDQVACVPVGHDGGW
jgi:AraC family transcriptional regulator